MFTLPMTPPPARVPPADDAELQRARLAACDVPVFDEVLWLHGLPRLEAVAPQVLQANLGRLCNQRCAHCHLDAGPRRTECMGRPTAERVIALLRRHPFEVLDLSGGAPELNPNFRWLVVEARALGRRVVDRCNLTVLLLPGQEDLVAFLAAQRVEVVASLPCHGAEDTDAQRGHGVFERSIEGLRRLNAAGYGRDPALPLTLVHNPMETGLPGDQRALESDYRRVLGERHGVVFDRLHVLTNMPLGRFLANLEAHDSVEAYLDLLSRSFSPATVEHLMCLTTLAVRWDGTLHDCDFNGALGIAPDDGSPTTLEALLESGGLSQRTVRTGPHCFGCTARAGSSCAGALV